MSAERHGFAFSPEAKQYVHDRAGLGLETGELANGKCEFPGEECFNKPEPFVAHLTGCYESFVNRRPQLDFKVFKDDCRPVKDPQLNALMQCKKHNEFHDAQERYQVAMALTNGLREHVLYESKPKHKRSKSHGRRRGRR